MDTRKKHRILGIIPARGGSKSIPRKNIKPLAGKPLLYYMLSAALKSNHLTHVVVSSEDAEILKIAREIGGDKVLLERPAALAQDDTPDVPMLQHAVEEMEERTGEAFDYIVQLHATSPFFTERNIDEALEMLLKHDEADSVVSVYRVPNMHPRKLKRIEHGKLRPYAPEYTEDTFLRRQDMEPVYKRNAGLYAAKRHVLMQDGRVWGDTVLAYEMSEEQSIDLDTPFDFYVADLIMRDRNKRSGRA
jgi:CMP-N,N'-diacetyllegionaminic acid synthase